MKDEYNDKLNDLLAFALNANKNSKYVKDISEFLTINGVTYRPKTRWVDTGGAYTADNPQYCVCENCGQRNYRPLGFYCKWCGAEVR